MLPAAQYRRRVTCDPPRRRAAAAALAVSRPVRAQGHLITLVTLHMAPLETPTIADLAQTATVPDTTPGGRQPSTGATAPGAATNVTPTAAASRAAPARHFASGTAVLTGHVVNAGSNPVAGARVFVVGASDSAVTGAAGNFALRRLPSGTRIVVVRAVGYEPVTQPVELTSRAPQDVTVSFTGRAVPTLRPVVVTAMYDSGLKRVGFDQRRMLGLGTFWTEKQIDSHKAIDFHDLFGTFPGVLIDYTEDGKASLMASRAAGSCIGYATGATGRPSMTVGRELRAVPDVRH